MRKKSFNHNQKGKKPKFRNLLMSTAVVSALALQPVVPVIEDDRLVGFEEESIEAAPLADVEILNGTKVSAALSDPGAAS